MSKPIVVLDPHWRQLDEIFSPDDLATLGSMCELVWARDEPMPRKVLEDHLATMSILIAARPALDASDLANAPKLRAVIEVSGAFPDTIDYAACFDRGVHVLSCAPGFRASVAEMAVAMALAGARGLVQEHEAFRGGSEHWLSDNVATDFSLYGQTIGFVGFGSIARECSRLLMPFGPRILAYDPWLKHEQFQEHSAVQTTLDDVMRCSRCLFVAATPTHENKGLIDAEAIAKMPRGALLVLISRAHLVDFDALVAAVREHRIRAAIDVFPTEPVANDDAVRSLPNAILSPHRAAAVRGGRQLIGRMIVEDVANLLRGQAPINLQPATPEKVARSAGAGHATGTLTLALARR